MEIFVFSDSTIIYTAVTAVHTRGKESSAEQVIVAVEKRAAEPNLRVAAALAVERRVRRPDPVFTDKHKSAECKNGRERDPEPAWSLAADR